MAFTRISKSNRMDEVKFKFEEEGDTIDGYYLGSETFPHGNKVLTKHRFKNRQGKVLSVLGGYVLNEDLPSVPKGTRVKITYEGKRKTKNGNTVGQYAIDVDAEDVLNESNQNSGGL